jgi:hypothetical protein
VSPQDRKREIGEELADLLTEYNAACDDCSPPSVRESMAARILELTHELDGQLVVAGEKGAA